MEKLLVMSGNHKIADQQFYECNVTIKSIHKKISVKIIDVLKAYETSYAHQGFRLSIGGEEDTRHGRLPWASVPTAHLHS